VLLVLIGSVAWLIAGISSPGKAQSVGGKATPHPPAVRTGTSTPGALKSYRDPSGHFTISYPGTWKLQPFQSKAAGLRPALTGAQFSKGSAVFTIASGTAPFFTPPGLAQLVDDALLSSLNARNISKPVNVSIGGQTWTEERADTNKGPIVVDSLDLTGQLYSLWYTAPQNEFTSDQSKVFLPIRESFTFG
jgi:hypothetical protein